jgi:hypothetical protein
MLERIKKFDYPIQTNDMQAFIQYEEDTYFNDIVLMPDAFRGKAMGSRTTSREAGNALSQAGKPFLDKVRYEADQLIRWEAEKNDELFQQFAPQKLMVALAEATGASILPVDSEHSAIAQLMGGEDRAAVERIVLTASGGPFRERMDLSEVTVDEALDHPTWKMGGRITIDSATLMNKGLEMIEAHHLFNVSYDRIEVVVHPQSIVHSLIDLVDGASLAHMGHPDMRVPIAWALSHPDRTELPVRRLDLAEVGTLDFERPDIERFPCLELARAAGEKGGISPCVMNAADDPARVRVLVTGFEPFGGSPLNPSMLAARATASRRWPGAAVRACILPVVGVPLPFVSYGGTAMISMGLGLGMLMAINRSRRLMPS